MPLSFLFEFPTWPSKAAITWHTFGTMLAWSYIEELHSSNKMSRMFGFEQSISARTMGDGMGCVIGAESRGSVGSVVSGEGGGGFVQSVLVRGGQWILSAPMPLLAVVLASGLLLLV